MKILLLVLAAVLLAVCADPKHDKEWKEFKAKHGRRYSPKEEGMRKSLHRACRDKVNKHNQERAEGKQTHSMAVNRFCDWTPEELKSLVNEVDVPIGQVKAPGGVIEEAEMRQSYPASLNWNTSSCMPPVQDQGICGDCYSFAAVAVADFLRCAATNTIVKLSEQAVADCSTPQGNAKCNGGLALWAWNYMMANGAPTGTSYPHTSGATGADGTCTYEPTVPKCLNMTTWGYTTQSWDESTILPALNHYGPVAVSIYATENFMNYAGGVYTTTSDCPSTATNHAMVAVGYGHDSALKMDYWVLRNSWGPEWGENGYIRVARGIGWCGIAKRPVYARVSATQPSC